MLCGYGVSAESAHGSGEETGDRRLGPGKSGRRDLPAAVLYLRVDFGEHGALGPARRADGAIAETGSISAAGRAMGMSYRRAWLLVDL